VCFQPGAVSQLRGLEQMTKRCIQLIKEPDTASVEDPAEVEGDDKLAARGCSWPAFVTHIKRSEAEA